MFNSIKMISIILIISSSSLIGYYFSRLDTYRLKDLINLKKILTMLTSEIKFSSLPLPLALEQISLRIDGKLSSFLKDVSINLKKRTGLRLSDIWATNLDKYSKSIYLNKTDIDNLKSFGKTLGYLDKDMQEKNIDLIINYLDEQIDILQKSYKNNSKMCKSLGVLGGLLIAIVLF